MVHIVTFSRRKFLETLLFLCKILYPPFQYSNNWVLHLKLQEASVCKFFIQLYMKSSHSKYCLPQRTITTWRMNDLRDPGASTKYQVSNCIYYSSGEHTKNGCSHFSMISFLPFLFLSFSLLGFLKYPLVWRVNLCWFTRHSGGFSRHVICHGR